MAVREWLSPLPEPICENVNSVGQENFTPVGRFYTCRGISENLWLWQPCIFLNFIIIRP